MAIPGSNAVFYETSPVLTSDAVRARRSAWEAGRYVTSGLVSIGRVVIGEEERILLQNLSPRQFDIGNEMRSRVESSDCFKDAPVLGALYASFMSIVSRDIKRGGMRGLEDVLLRALDPQTEPLDWHVDPAASQVRYTMGVGVGSSTRGAIGQFCSDDVGLISGDVHPGVQLEPQPPFEQGTVVRFMVGDVHASPICEERIFLRDLIHLSK